MNNKLRIGLLATISTLAISNLALAETFPPRSISDNVYFGNTYEVNARDTSQKSPIRHPSNFHEVFHNHQLAVSKVIPVETKKTKPLTMAESSFHLFKQYN